MKFQVLIAIALLLAGCTGTQYELDVYDGWKERDAQLEAIIAELEARPEVDAYMVVADENVQVDIQMLDYEELQLVVGNTSSAVVVITDLSVFIMGEALPLLPVSHAGSWRTYSQMRIPVAPKQSHKGHYRIPTRVNDINDVTYMVGYETGNMSAYVVVTTADIVR